jgi:uncharacterized membrane protein YtjA (UPF0391 family)
MLRWALVFLIVALIAALFGFGVIEGYSLLAAKVLFIVFLIMFVASLIMGSRGSRNIV